MSAPGASSAPPASGAAIPATRGRVGTVDLLRAAAALAVLGIHAYALGGRTVPVRAQHVYDVALAALASGVWLFFAISGYVIGRPFLIALVRGEPAPAPVPYALRRGARIFPLYWVALAALIAIAGAAGTRAWQLVFHVLLLHNLIPGREEALFPAAWTLTLEVLFYLAVPLLAYGARRFVRELTAERLAALILISWALSIAFTAFADTRGDGQTGVWLRFTLPSMWQMFCPGLLLALAPHLRAPRWRRWLAGGPHRPEAFPVAGLALLLAAILAEAAPVRFGLTPYELLTDLSRPLYAIGYGIVLAAALRRRGGERSHPLLLELGLVSYGIYLLHPVIAALLVEQGWVPLARDTLPAFILHGVLLTLLTVPVAILSWRVLERPMIGWARAAAGRRAPTMAGMAPVDANPPPSPSDAHRPPSHSGVHRPSSPSGAHRPSSPSGVHRPSSPSGAHRPSSPSGVPPPSSPAGAMRQFWNERAREDAFYFVDTRQRYGAPDPKRFWEGGELLDFVCASLEVSLTGSETVLDLGCGLGRLTRPLADRADAVVALDVSDEMLARARALNPELANVHWLLGDGASLAGIDTGSLDAAISLVVFQHLPEPAIGLGYVRELGRVLRAGGWAAIQVSDDPEIHRPRDGILLRLRARFGRAPRGQRHPAWLGSRLQLDDVRTVGAQSGLELERVWSPGTQYCLLLLRRVL